MLVKATEQYEKLNVIDSLLGKIPKSGEEFEVTEERFNRLTNNKYKVAFVEKLNIEEAEESKKKTRKKKE